MILVLGLDPEGRNPSPCTTQQQKGTPGKQNDDRFTPAFPVCGFAYVFGLRNGPQCWQIVTNKWACPQTALMTLNIIHQQTVAICQPNNYTQIIQK